MIFWILSAVLALIAVGVAASLGLRSRRGMRLILVLGIIAVVFVTSPITLAWAIWLNATAECGRQPVAATRFAAAYSYDVPGDSHYSPGLFPILLPEYYCTEADALAHGFSRDQYP